MHVRCASVLEHACKPLTWILIPQHQPDVQGDPVPQTRSSEEREAPLQVIDHPALLSRLDAEEERMRRLVCDVLDREPDAPWTGRRMAVAKFILHLRNEHALHQGALVRVIRAPGPLP